jgi:catechol 2,3-dioxygenase-like lactoylglutathione lyase family enzyme
MQPSRIHDVGLPVSDLDLSVAWYREALGLTHEAAAGVAGGVAFVVAPTGERLELLAVDPQNSPWDDSSGGNRGQMEPSSCAIRARAAEGTFSNTGPGLRS